MIRIAAIVLVGLWLAGCSQVSPQVTNPAYPYPVYDTTPPAKAGKRF